MKVRHILPILTIGIMLVATDCSTRSETGGTEHSALLTFTNPPTDAHRQQ